MTKAIVFPGQGSQFVGMGKDLYDAFLCARHIFEEVDSTLGQNLSRLIFDGTPDDLTLTENAQPALMTISMAVVTVLEKEFNIPITHFTCAAGHSLGEYGALAATKAFDVATTAKLLRLRGQAMQRAVPYGAGGMIAVLGGTPDIVQEIATAAAAYGVCTIANDNSPGQIVLSGDITAITAVPEIAKEKGISKCIPLKVSAPFHCPLMAPAAQEMETALRSIEITQPLIPVYHNVLAEPAPVDSIKNLLVQQITGQVRWRETIEHMALKDVIQVVEVGAGKVLAGLTKRINGDLMTASLGTPAEIEEFANSLTK